MNWHYLDDKQRCRGNECEKKEKCKRYFPDPVPGFWLTDKLCTQLDNWYSEATR